MSNWKIGYRTGLEFIEYLALEYRDLDKPFPRKPDVEEPPKPKQSEQERLQRQEMLQKRFCKGKVT